MQALEAVARLPHQVSQEQPQVIAKILAHLEKTFELPIRTCHCKRCRKAGAGTFVVVKRSAFRLAAGADSIATWKSVTFQLAVHVPFWALVPLGFAVLEDDPGVQAGDASEKWAMIIGLAVIGFGLIIAGLGGCVAWLDDSEEARDLRHERRALLLGAVALVCAGASLILLCFAGPGRLVSGTIAAPVALLLNICAATCVAIRWRRLDELNRGVARDAGYLAFTVFSWVGGTWAMLAHLAIVAPPAPIDWVTMFHGFSFFAGLIAASRKGIFDEVADSTRRPQR
jgi:hypothetical protein